MFAAAQETTLIAMYRDVAIACPGLDSFLDRMDLPTPLQPQNLCTQLIQGRELSDSGWEEQFLPELGSNTIMTHDFDVEKAIVTYWMANEDTIVAEHQARALEAAQTAGELAGQLNSMTISESQPGQAQDLVGSMLQMSVQAQAQTEADQRALEADMTAWMNMVFALAKYRQEGGKEEEEQALMRDMYHLETEIRTKAGPGYTQHEPRRSM